MRVLTWLNRQPAAVSREYHQQRVYCVDGFEKEEEYLVTVAVIGDWKWPRTSKNGEITRKSSFISRTVPHFLPSLLRARSTVKIITKKAAVEPSKLTNRIVVSTWLFYFLLRLWKRRLRADIDLSADEWNCPWELKKKRGKEKFKKEKKDEWKPGEIIIQQ